MDLRECLDKIDSSLDYRYKNSFRLSKRDELFQYHHRFGKWIRNNCFLWSDDGLDEILPDLKKLIENGIILECSYDNKIYTVDNIPDHPDDISGIILEIYHDILNDKIYHDDVAFAVDGMSLLYIIPYNNGVYYGDKIQSWLEININEDRYIIIKHPIAVQLSSIAYPTRYAFYDKEDAVAFKLRWL